jgi:hypothetical protein
MTEQLTAQMIGVPTEVFDALKNVVAHTKITGSYTAAKQLVRVSAAEQKVINDKYKADLRAAAFAGKPRSSVPVPTFYRFVTKFTPTQRTERFGVYLLNYVHDAIWQYGFEYKGMIGSEFLFTKFYENYTASDMVVYENIEITVKIFNQDGKWIVMQSDNVPVQYYSVNGELTPFTKEQIAGHLNATVETVEAQEADYWVCEERDPSTYITSIFPVIESPTDFSAYINGMRADLVDFKNMISNTGVKSFKDYDIEMIAYNDCPVPAQQISDAASMGDGGECKAQWFETETEAKSFVYDFDLTKENAVLGFHIEVSAPNGTPNGHYERFHSYLNLKTGKVMQSPFDK